MAIDSLRSPFIFNLEAGLILDTGVFGVPPGAAIQLVNFEPDISGGYRRINGHTKWNSTAPNGTGKVIMSAILGSRVIAARNATISHATTTSSWTNIVTNRTSAGRYDHQRFNFGLGAGHSLVFVDGVNAAATWDGTTYTLLNGSIGSGSGTAPTAPEKVEIFNDHIFFLQGRTLTWTAPFSTNDFTPANGAGQINLDCSGNGLKVFRNILYIFCEDRIYKLIGTSIENFELNFVTRNIGCVSGFSIQEVGGDVVFQAPDGLRTIAGTEKLGDVELASFSRNIHPRFDTDITTGLIASVVIRGKTQYRSFFPDSEIQETSSVFGNISVFKRKGWEFSDIRGFKPSSTDSYFISNTETVIFGDYDGFIQQMESGNNLDGSNITYIYQSPFIHFGDAGLRKIMERAILNLTAEGAVTFNLNMVYDFEDTNIPQPVSVSITITPGAVYDTGVYGTSSYGGSFIPLTNTSVIGSGFVVSMKISGDSSSTPPFSIKGVELEFIPGGRN